MFKNYLTYQFALSFHRLCSELVGLEPAQRHRVMRSAETMIHHFARAVHARDPKDEAKTLFVTLLSLRDCKESLDEFGVHHEEIEAKYSLIHQRLEQLCEKIAAENENGQFRMLG